MKVTQGGGSFHQSRWIARAAIQLAGQIAGRAGLIDVELHPAYRHLGFYKA
jgi:hypothetical protein